MVDRCVACMGPIGELAMECKTCKAKYHESCAARLEKCVNCDAALQVTASSSSDFRTSESERKRSVAEGVESAEMVATDEARAELLRLLDLGKEAEDKGEYAVALERYLSALKCDDSDPQVYEKLAKVSEKLKKYDDAVKYYKRLVALQKNAATIYNAALRIQKMGKTKEALSLLNSGLAEQPNSWQLWYAKGKIMLEAGKIRIAIICLQNAVSILPEEEDIWWSLSAAYQKASNFEKALECYYVLYELKGHVPEVLMGMADTYMAMGDYERALQAYGGVTGVRPDHGVAWMNMGLCYYFLGDYEAAIRALSESLRVTPRNVRALTRMWAVYAAMGREKEARKWLERARALNSRVADEEARRLSDL